MTLPRLPALMGTALLLCGSAAFAANKAPSALQQERAACARCPRKAAAPASARPAQPPRAARSGGPSSADASTYERNALARCDAFQAPQDKAECQARMGSRATVGGSVEGGGLLRELTTTTIRTVP
ncbi:MAG: hypothetical protein U1E74_06810 [Paenacidovorax caeni]